MQSAGQVEIARRPLASRTNEIRVERKWAHSRERHLEAKRHLFMEGDAKSFVYKVASGAVCLYRIQRGGRRQIIEFAFEGDVIGLGVATAEECNAQALVLTRLKCIPVVTLVNAVRQDASVALGMFEALSHQLLTSRQHLSCLGQRSATERLATFLVSLSRRNQDFGRDPGVLMLPVTRIDIADYLGLTIETVSRTFSKLKSRGVIQIENYKTIRIRNVGELEWLAGG
jgi:CRP/FNR family transcriptional regulator